MLERIIVQRALRIGIVLTALAMGLSLFNLSLWSVKPNVFLVGVLALVFFVEVPETFFAMLAAQLLWMKYIPSVTYELAAIAAYGAIMFFVVRAFVLRRNFVIFCVFLLMGQAIFWGLFAPSGTLFSVPFLLEFMYNVGVGSVAYIVGLWAKKRFS
jgi:hypothetical protein